MGQWKITSADTGKSVVWSEAECRNIFGKSEWKEIRAGHLPQITVVKVEGEKPMNNRSLYEIASEVRQDWKKVYFGAVPYLDAMGSLTSIEDDYGLDSAKSVVLYFLANASTWRGETARRVKAELRAMVK